MPRKQRQTFYVISAGRRPTTGSRWITRAGTITTSRSKAARFVTMEAAQNFAEVHAIKVNGVHRSIDLEEFTAFELSVYPG
jgi:hypothetical protein